MRWVPDRASSAHFKPFHTRVLVTQGLDYETECVIEGNRHLVGLCH